MTETSPPFIAVIGGGPAGLMAAEAAARSGARVTIYDGMPSVGRKFLMAGRGGLNLTHSEPLEKFLTRYIPLPPSLRAAIEALPPDALREWCEALGEPTFVGSSGRVFPKSMKASPLLRRWLRRLGDENVTFKLRHHWTGWNANGELTFRTPGGDISIACDAAILALGGASWPRLGSSGDWIAPLSAAGVALTPLQPSNCGFAVRWSNVFTNRFEGQPLKRIALSFRGVTSRGEAMVTREGLEGGAVYALSPPLRDALGTTGTVQAHVDLRPDIAHAVLTARLDAPRGKQSMASFLRRAAGLSPVAVGLLHEALIGSDKTLGALSANALAQLIKAVPVVLTGIAPIARAISTAGGVAFDELDASFMLKRRPGVFVAGEMLDVDAPTGGYLLQEALATGAAAGKGAARWLGEKRRNAAG